MNAVVILKVFIESKLQHCHLKLRYYTCVNTFLKSIVSIISWCTTSMIYFIVTGTQLYHALNSSKSELFSATGTAS